MKIWRLFGRFDHVCEGLTFCDMKQGLNATRLIGKSREAISPVWETIAIKKERNGIINDYNLDLRAPVLTERAAAVLSPLIKDEAELLPLLNGDKHYYILNIYNIIPEIFTAKLPN